MARLRRPSLAAALLSFSLTLALGAWAQGPGSAPNPEAARAAFRKASEQARRRMLDAIDRQIDAAKKVGKIEDVDQFAAQKSAFLSSGALPQAPGLQGAVRTFQSDRRGAARELAAALRVAEEAATKADRLDEARRLRQERLEHEGNTAQELPLEKPTDPAVLIQAGAVWEGFARVVRKNPSMEKKGVHDIRIRIRITDRDGNAFKGVYSVDQGEFVTEIDGWLGKSAQSRNGTWREVTFQFSRNRGSKKGAVGPNTAHPGQVRAGVWKGTMPALRQGQGVVASAFELAPIADPEPSDGPRLKARPKR